MNEPEESSEAFNYSKIGRAKTPHRLLLKQHSIGMMKGLFNDFLRSGKSPEMLLKGFNPLPSVHLRGKFKYFYEGYAPAANLRKYMDFDEEEQKTRLLQSYV